MRSENEYKGWFKLILVFFEPLENIQHTPTKTFGHRRRWFYDRIMYHKAREKFSRNERRSYT